MAVARIEAGKVILLPFRSNILFPAEAEALLLFIVMAALALLTIVICCPKNPAVIPFKAVAVLPVKTVTD